MSKKLLSWSIILFIVFCLFTFLVARHTFTLFDWTVTTTLQSKFSHMWDLPFSLLSLIGLAETTTIIWFSICLFIFLKHQFKTLLAFMIYWAGSFIEIYSKVFLSQPQPPASLYRGIFNFNFPSASIQTGNSYPSGHMFRTVFLMTFILLYLIKRFPQQKVILLITLTLGIFLMAISRVYLAEHWLSDVIGGTLLGMSLGIVAAIPIPNNIRRSKDVV